MNANAFTKLRLPEPKLTAVLTLILILFSAISLEAQTPQITVVANNLNCPRGLAFRSDGALYVTEAGYNGFGTQIPGPVEGVILDYGKNSTLR